MKKRERLLLLLKEGPRRFKELARESDLSQEGLSKALKELMKEGLVEKLPDGSYFLTEAGRSVADELEVLELVREAIRQYGAAAVREAVSHLIIKRIETVVMEVEVVNTLIRVLRAWATTTAYWLAAKGVEHVGGVGDEERRALMIVEATLRKVGGEQWYRKYAILLYPYERAGLERKSGEKMFPTPLTAFVSPEGRRKALRKVEEELAAIRQERLNLLETSLRDAILTLLQLIEERRRELAAARQERRESGFIWVEVAEAEKALSLWLYGVGWEPLQLF